MVSGYCKRAPVDQAHGRVVRGGHARVGVGERDVQDVHAPARLVDRDPVLQRADVDVEHVHADVLAALQERVGLAVEDQRTRERVGRLAAVRAREVLQRSRPDAERGELIEIHRDVEIRQPRLLDLARIGVIAGGPRAHQLDGRPCPGGAEDGAA